MNTMNFSTTSTDLNMSSNLSGGNKNTLVDQVSRMQILQNEKSPEDIRKTVIVNSLYMIKNRGWISEEDRINLTKKFNSSHSDDNVYSIPLRKKVDNYDKLVIKYVPEHITAVGRSSGITEFIGINKDNTMLIITKSIKKKAAQSFEKLGSIEFFEEHELMIDIVQHIAVPSHRVVSPEEAKDIKNQYRFQNKNLPRMYHNKPIAKYYKMKIGDIVHIVRPDDKSGQNFTYRIVVKGPTN